MQQQFPNQTIHYIAADFTQLLNLPPLKGIVMADAIHYVRDKENIVQQIYNYLLPGGNFILIEYYIMKDNPWVPYPISYKEWHHLVKRLGFAETRLVATQPSRFHHQIYTTVSVKK